ncbi:MAG: hypothetical protein ACI9N0_003206 [Ilumatobacter sp.]|jgi:hypothetical protein
MENETPRWRGALVSVSGCANDVTETEIKTVPWRRESVYISGRR